MHKRGMTCLCCMLCVLSFAQTDTLYGEDQVIIAANKWAQKLNEIPNKVIKIKRSDILFANPQTAADLLNQTGAVFMQKSQLGGGSPMIRGFATNRVLLVIDGVRMNNAIYRSGNLQNVISLDALATQSAEVIFGPGSIVYGSDAIGGVMSFSSLDAPIGSGGKGKVAASGSGLIRYSTANRERTAHADIKLGSKKWGYMGSVTFSKFDDLKMGKNGGQNEYLKPTYVQRINNRDSIIPNSDPRKQVQSGYEQWNVVQKIRFKPSDALDLQYTFYYGGTGTAPRYDRLIETQNNNLRFAEWNYGPMLWRMHSLQTTLLKKNGFYDKVRFTAAYQNYEESRIDRQRNDANRRTQLEKVSLYTFNFDANKAIGKGELYYGLESVSNQIQSSGWRDNINTGIRSNEATRYPGGSTWNSYGAYGSYKINVIEKITLSTGLRYNYTTAKATFDKTFVPYPFDKADIKDGALTGNIGIVFRPADGWQLNGNITSGFRVPNIDDLGKLFESNPGNVVMPNANLQSEYAWNFETSIGHQKANSHRVEITGFYTRLINAIVRRPFLFNGQDSIVFDGVKSRVEALQNVGLATIWGLQAFAEVWVHHAFSLYTAANFISGRETDDVRNEQVPSRHAPPFFGRSGFKWEKGALKLEGFFEYNSEVSHENLAPAEQPKSFIYAKDNNGNSYSPGWYTANLRSSYQYKNLALTLGWENITDQRYRPYSSGIVAAGSNVIIGLRMQY